MDLFEDNPKRCGVVQATSRARRTPHLGFRGLQTPLPFARWNIPVLDNSIAVAHKRDIRLNEDASPDLQFERFRVQNVPQK